MGRRIVLVILIVLAVTALVTAVSAGFFHAGYWGTAGGHVMQPGPGYYGYGRGWGFFPGFFLFPLILLLIVAAVFWRPWHRHYRRYGYGPGRWSRGYWGPGPYGPGPYGPGAWFGPGASGGGAGGPSASGPGGASGFGASGPGMGDPDAGPDVSGTTTPPAGARDAGLWNWLAGPHQVFDEWHRQAHAGPAGPPQGGQTTDAGAWAPPAAPPVPPETSAPTPQAGGDVSPPPGEPPTPPQAPDGVENAS